MKTNNKKERKMFLVIDYNGIIFGRGYTKNSAENDFKKYCKDVGEPLNKDFFFDIYGNPYEGNFKSEKLFNLIEAITFKKLSQINADSEYREIGEY